MFGHFLDFFPSSMHVVCKISFVVIIFNVCIPLFVRVFFLFMFWPGLVSVAARGLSQSRAVGLSLWWLLLF